jgi:hypothetical protein
MRQPAIDLRPSRLDIEALLKGSSPRLASGRESCLNSGNESGSEETCTNVAAWRPQRGLER